MKHIVSKHTDYADFPVGTKVRIVTGYVDTYFFYGETGEVVKNSHDYLGIRVRFDQPRLFKDGYVQKDFNFNPEDLIIRGRREPLFERIGIWESKKLRPLTKEEIAAEKAAWR